MLTDSTVRPSAPVHVRHLCCMLLQNNSLVPRPTRYPGTSRPPLLSGNADGIHITQASQGYV